MGLIARLLSAQEFKILNPLGITVSYDSFLNYMKSHAELEVQEFNKAVAKSGDSDYLVSIVDNLNRVDVCDLDG